jgi:hypothetical protein
MKPRHDKGRLPPFVPLLKDTLATSAWRAMSHGARSLYVALKLRYSSNFNNNGRIFLSQRDAAEELNSHHNQIARWFRELQYFGFIVMTEGGCLGVEGRGKAPHWRLTEIGYMKAPPTRDFDRWNGKPFPEKKLKSRAGFLARGVLENAHTSVLENAHTQAAKCAGKRAHKNGGVGVLENAHITRDTISRLEKREEQGRTADKTGAADPAANLQKNSKSPAKRMDCPDDGGIPDFLRRDAVPIDPTAPPRNKFS